MTSKLDRLSKEEREYALKILKDISNGKDGLYNNLLKEDYNEIPVDIETFIHDPYYLGRGLMNAEGKFTLFPY